jgi:hypothetical protein
LAAVVEHGLMLQAVLLIQVIQEVLEAVRHFGILMVQGRVVLEQVVKDTQVVQSQVLVEIALELAVEVQEL